MRATLVSLASLCLLASCVTHRDDGNFLTQYPELEQAMAELRQEQAKFAGKNEVPKNYDFPDAGRVTVRLLSLDGYPGNTYVRCRFLYQNTTGKPVVRSWVSLDVLDANGKLVASHVSLCIIPVPMPIAQGSFFADELRTPTKDAHLQPGWSWRVTCKAELEEPETPIKQ